MGTGTLLSDAMKLVPITEPNLTAVRRTVIVVALLNLAYFGIEFAVARAIGSVSCSRIPSTSWKTRRSTG